MPAGANVVECECTGLVPSVNYTSCPTALVPGLREYQPTMYADGGFGPPYGDSGYDGNLGNVRICGALARREVCFPASLNPNQRFADGGVVDPDAAAVAVTAAALDNFCRSAVQQLVDEASGIVYFGSCNPQVECHARLIGNGDGGTAVLTRTNDNCNSACPAVPVVRTDDGLANVPFVNDKGTFVTAPNRACRPLAANTTPVCRPSAYDPPSVPPDPLLGGVVGRITTAALTSSSVTVTIGTDPPVNTTATGRVTIQGQPCPGASCNVGLYFALDVASFASSGYVFENVTVSGSGAPPGLALNASGVGQYATNRFFATVRAVAKSGATSSVQSFYLPNYAPLNATVNWSAGTVTVNIDETIPAGAGMPSSPPVRVQLSFTAAFENSPPYNASAGADRTLECTTTAGAPVTLTATATDRENNIMSYAWARSPATAPVSVGSGSSITVYQPPGVATYGVDVIDALYATAGARTQVTVVDTAPPTNATPTIEFGCADRRPRDIFGTLCQLFPQGGARPATDACDATPQILPTQVRVYDALGTLVQTVQCGGPYPLATTDTAAVFEVRWTSRDATGNSSPAWATRVRVRGRFPSARCTGQPFFDGEVLYSGSVASAPALTVQARSSFDFAALTPGAITTPAGLAFARTTVATVQSSDRTIVTGIAAGAPRVGNDGANHLGLVLEETRTNLVTNARDLNSAGWIAGYGTTVSNAATSPDGLVRATRSSVPANGYSRYQALGAATGNYTASAWIASPSGAAVDYQLFNELDPSTGRATAGLVGSAWLRAAVTYNFASGSTTSYLVPVETRNRSTQGGVTARAIDNLTDLYQFEAGAFPTEVILTAGAAATRAAESLSASDPTLFVQGGRVALELRVQPKGASTEYGAPWIDLWSRGSDYVSYSTSAGVLYIVIGGVTNSVGGLTWQRGDTIDLFVAAGAGTTSVVWRINDRAIVTGTVSGPSLGSVAASGTVNLLSNATNYQFSAWVQQLRAWQFGKTPRWLLD